MLLVEIVSFGLPLNLSGSKCVFITRSVGVANLQQNKQKSNSKTIIYSTKSCSLLIPVSTILKVYGIITAVWYSYCSVV